MIKVMGGVLWAAVFLVSMSGWCVARQAKPEHPTAKPEPPKSEEKK